MLRMERFKQEGVQEHGRNQRVGEGVWEKRMGKLTISSPGMEEE